MTEEHDPVHKTLSDLRAWLFREGTYTVAWPVQSAGSVRWHELNDILARLHEELGYDYFTGARVRAVKALGPCLTDDQIAKRVAVVTAQQKPRAHEVSEQELLRIHEAAIADADAHVSRFVPVSVPLREVGYGDDHVAFFSRKEPQRLKEEEIQDAEVQTTVKAAGVPIALEAEAWDESLVTMRVGDENE